MRRTRNPCNRPLGPAPLTSLADRPRARCTVSKEQVNIYRTQLAGIGNRIRCEPSQSQSAKQERSTPSSYKPTLLQTIFDDVTEKRREGVPLSADIERESMNKETRT
ncbi:hypothetical protein KXW42_001091 [Aspergillus fumigatus]|nr:hypothetical protein KXX48_000821 [Aspergillus fumigatus]KAH1405540.1 hypothetical protein KXX51_008924 [Aspergillus fumigatus]KAH1442073.1 hypothetical protein KXX68_001463 [Aspergillus fumigatus]KAH1842264.1 hypothetical protein KXX43_008029 [Aspergillus fumigatus]KAH1870350.1 hypothetical protein KXX08_001341 [Aspergillus fumigatus]